MTGDTIDFCWFAGDCVFSTKFLFSEPCFAEESVNLEAMPGETVMLMTELPEPGLEVVWLKDNVPLSLNEERYETVNEDCSYNLVIPGVGPEDSGIYTVQGGGFETSVPLTVLGKYSQQTKSHSRFDPMSDSLQTFTKTFPFDSCKEQRTEIQYAEATTGETVALSSDLPELGLEVTWLKDNVPLSIGEGRYETVNQDCSYHLVIPNATSEDEGIYTVQGGGYEASVRLIVDGGCTMETKCFSAKPFCF